MIHLDKGLNEIKITPREFEELIIEAANDRSWCAMNKINYVNPNFSDIKEKLYQELLCYSKEEEQ